VYLEGDTQTRSFEGFDTSCHLTAEAQGEMTFAEGVLGMEGQQIRRSREMRLLVRYLLFASRRSGFESVFSSHGRSGFIFFVELAQELQQRSRF